MRQPSILAVAAAAALLTSGCALWRKPPVEPDPRLGSRTAALGDPARFEGVTLTPVAVVEDSRCPVGAQCVQAGTARVSTAIVAGGVSLLRVLALGETVPVAGRTATLSAVCPAPRVHRTVLSTDTRVTFTLSEIGAPPAPQPGCAEG